MIVQHLVMFFAGLLFGCGLIVSGMINPAKVLGFLDVFGAWDASLVFVMAAAVIVNTLGYRLTMRRPMPLFQRSFALPQRVDIDGRLVGGAVLFGVGWGLIGLCPGPAVAATLLAPERIAVFGLAMLAGMAVARRLTPVPPADPQPA